MVARLMLIFLCLGVLSTVLGCNVEPASYRTPSYEGETDYGTRQYRKQGVKQDWLYRPWERHMDYGAGD